MPEPVPCTTGLDRRAALQAEASDWRPTVKVTVSEKLPYSEPVETKLMRLREPSDRE